MADLRRTSPRAVWHHPIGGVVLVLVLTLESCPGQAQGQDIERPTPAPILAPRLAGVLDQPAPPLATIPSPNKRKGFTIKPNTPLKNLLPRPPKADGSKPFLPNDLAQV